MSSYSREKRQKILNKMEKNNPGITDKMDSIIRAYFPEIPDGAIGLREQQLVAINDIISHKDAMVLMPTSGGKSACFQIPTLLWDDSITIVISPIRALIKNQVERLNNAGNHNSGSNVATIFAGRFTMDMYYGGANEGANRGANGGVNGEANEEANGEANEGSNEYNDSNLNKRIEGIINGDYRFIYITPEMLNNVLFLRVIRRIRDKVRLIAVDEAHCISMWGYSFRPAYLNIRRFIDSFPERPVVAAFTATATNQIAVDTVNALGLRISALRGVGLNVYERPDLNYHIVPVNLFRKNSNFSEDKSLQYRKGQIVSDIIKKYVENDEKGIIFCATQNQVEQIASYIEKSPNSIKQFNGKLSNRVSRYYGKDSYRKKLDANGNQVAVMNQESRKNNLDKFVTGDALVMVSSLLAKLNSSEYPKIEPDYDFEES